MSACCEPPRLGKNSTPITPASAISATDPSARAPAPGGVCPPQRRAIEAAGSSRMPNGPGSWKWGRGRR